MLKLLCVVSVLVFSLVSCNVTQPNIIQEYQATFHYSITKKSQVKVVVINSYNTTVEKILEDKVRAAGAYTDSWDFKNENDQKVVRGLYYFQLYINGDLVQTYPIIGVDK